MKRNRYDTPEDETASERRVVAELEAIIGGEDQQIRRGWSVDRRHVNSDRRTNQGGSLFDFDEDEEEADTFPASHYGEIDPTRAYSHVQSEAFRDLYNKSAPARLKTIPDPSLLPYPHQMFPQFLPVPDIRMSEAYGEFYREYEGQDRSKLPPPFEQQRYWFEDFPSTPQPSWFRRQAYSPPHSLPRRADLQEPLHQPPHRRSVPRVHHQQGVVDARRHGYPRRNPNGPPNARRPQMHPQQDSPSCVQQQYDYDGPYVNRPPGHERDRRRRRSCGRGGRRPTVRRTEREQLIEERIARFYGIKDLKGKVYFLAKDQYGCRFLQNKLGEDDEESFEQIFRGVLKHLVKLMSDSFGNYLCQKLIDVCNDAQRHELLACCMNSLVDISTNIHGTRSVQKLVDTARHPETRVLLISALQPFVVNLVKDLYGNHVIQRCLKVFSDHDKQFIFDQIVTSCEDVSTHKHGCCVIQRCFDYANIAQKVQLIEEISRHALLFVLDPYANYVVQYVLNLAIGEWNTRIMDKFVGHVYELSKNKFGSNVVEKCLKIAHVRIRNKFVEEIAESMFLPDLLQDRYGNYVIQTAIKVSTQMQHEKLVMKIRPLLHLIKNTKYVRNIEIQLRRYRGARE